MNGSKRAHMVRRQNHARREMAARVVSVLKDHDQPLSVNEITQALDAAAPPDVWWRVCGALENMEEQRQIRLVRSAVRRSDGARVYALMETYLRLQEAGRIQERVMPVAPLRELAKEF